MSAWTIREGTGADVDAWFALRRRLWPDFDPAEERAIVDAYASGARVPNVDVVFLAFDAAERPLGFAEFSIREYVPGARGYSVPFLEGWFVVEDARGNGIGRALVEAGERWAIARGHAQLGSDVDPDNDLSIRAHEGLSFREVERAVFFLKDLGAPSAPQG